MLKVANVASLVSYSMPVCTSVFPSNNLTRDILCWRISLTLLNILVKMDDNMTSSVAYWQFIESTSAFDNLLKLYYCLSHKSLYFVDCLLRIIWWQFFIVTFPIRATCPPILPSLILSLIQSTCKLLSTSFSLHLLGMRSIKFTVPFQTLLIAFWWMFGCVSCGLNVELIGPISICLAVYRLAWT